MNHRKFSEELTKALLLSIIFLTGGSLLVMEVIAVRILSPYFGNTIFSFSSVISTVLGALSVGYYLGGKFADKHPTLRHFFGMILLSGLSILLSHTVAISMLPVWGYALSLVWGPLVVSILLFSIPSIFLGTLSPYSITLLRNTLSSKGIGSLSGEVFFWSTLGSIAGSLSAGFLIIPHMGVRAGMTSVAVLLITMGMLGLAFVEKHRRTLLVWVAVTAATVLYAGVTLFAEPVPPGLVYRTDGTYEQISVLDRMFEGQRVRFLLQDRNFSSAEFLDHEGIVFKYAKHLALQPILMPSPERSLVIGAGAYTLPRLLAEHPTNVVDAVDIEPELPRISREYFKLDDSPNIHHHFVDGRRFLHDVNAKYDFIFNDAYGANLAIPSHMITREFFMMMKNSLASDGVVIANFIGSLDPDAPSLFHSSVRTFRSVFPNSYFFATENTETYDLQNTVFVAINNDIPWDPCAQSLRSSEDPTLASLCERKIDIRDDELIAHRMFTDDFAPTDYYAARHMRHFQ